MDDMPTILMSLDFQKDFDSFDVTFTTKMLEHAGLPPAMLKWWGAIYAKLQRTIKIGHTLGARFRLYNGLGQGDPLSLFPAILLVHWQFSMVRRLVPDVSLGAAIDDRNVRGTRQDVLRAHALMVSFDVAAGHCTQADKTKRKQRKRGQTKRRQAKRGQTKTIVALAT